MADLPPALAKGAPPGRAIEVPRRPNWGRAHAERRWLERGLLASLFVHGMILAIVLLAKHLPGAPPPQPPQEGMEMVFENGQQSPIAVPHPKNRFIEIPRGEADGTVEQRATPPTPPPTPPAQPAPQLSLSPYEPLPPLPQTQQSDQAASPTKARHEDKPRRRQNPNTNPFAHLAIQDFAPHPPSHARGLRNSRSIDLSMGPVIQGGQLRDAIPHIASAGADGDYMEMLSEYVETHKYYPEQAGRNGEQGTAVVRVLMSRDGTVKDVRLEQSAESHMLDLALESMFRDKRLPPFPDDMKEAEKEFTISMTYEIVH